MKNAIVIVLAIAFCSCAQNPQMDMAKDSTASDAVPSSPTQNVSAVAEFGPRVNSKLIKTADYRFQVKNIAKTTEAIEGLMQKYPAHITGADLTSEGNIIESTITIRVESAYFPELLKEIDKEAIFVHSKNIRTEDVGKQFVDLESRLKTKREVQERYKEILRKKAGTIEELLSAEKQIGELQEEIEATVSKLNYLKDQVAQSTINLHFYEKTTVAAQAEPGNNLLPKFGKAFLNGFNGAVEILIALTNLWPLLLLSLAGLILLHKKRKRAGAAV